MFNNKKKRLGAYSGTQRHEPGALDLFRATVSIGRVRMRVRAATARMHAHTHVILAIASQMKGSQETKTRVVVLPGLCFSEESKQQPARNTRAVFIRASASGLGGDPKKKAQRRIDPGICCAEP